MLKEELAHTQKELSNTCQELEITKAALFKTNAAATMSPDKFSQTGNGTPSIAQPWLAYPFSLQWTHLKPEAIGHTPRGLHSPLSDLAPPSDFCSVALEIPHNILRFFLYPGCCILQVILHGRSVHALECIECIPYVCGEGWV